MEAARAEGSTWSVRAACSRLTQKVLETALEAEMSERLGYDRHDPAGATAPTPVTAPGRRPC